MADPGEWRDWRPSTREHPFETLPVTPFASSLNPTGLFTGFSLSLSLSLWSTRLVSPRFSPSLAGYLFFSGHSVAHFRWRYWTFLFVLGFTGFYCVCIECTLGFIECYRL